MKRPKSTKFVKRPASALELFDKSMMNASREEFKMRYLAFDQIFRSIMRLRAIEDALSDFRSKLEAAERDRV